MDNAQQGRRERMLEKVRKLLAMGRDGRGNATEEETAMRQANKLMAEYGIAEAECDMAAINAGEMSFGEAMSGPDGRAPEAGRVYRSMPGYVGILAIGIARFTDSVVVRKHTANGEMLAFQGEKQDVLFARWLVAVLVNSILSEQKASGWTARGEASSFRVSAASALARRLKALAEERKAMYRAAQVNSNCMALVVVDRKHTEIVKRFGEQKVRRSQSSASCSGASMAGHEAGQKISIPSGRPISGNSNKTLSA